MTKNKKNAFLITSSLFILLFSIYYVAALPSAPTITQIKNETSNNTGVGTLVGNDPGGYIVTVDVDTKQQNYKWKAYVGNVTGELVLEDQSQKSIYKWDMDLNSLGNVFISRESAVDWTTVNCSNETIILAEDTNLSLNSSKANSINQTFSYTSHKSFKLRDIPYDNSTCRSTATYINNTAQTVNESAKFQEILLQDADSNLIYMTMMEQDQQGFDNDIYDFQAIVAEKETGSPSSYYFYVELGS